MYKVLIYQHFKGVRTGMILCEDFKRLNDARSEAMEHSQIYDLREFVVRKYDDSVSNVISFESHDTGEIRMICYGDNVAVKVDNGWYIEGKSTIESLGNKYKDGDFISEEVEDTEKAMLEYVSKKVKEVE